MPFLRGFVVIAAACLTASAVEAEARVRMLWAGAGLTLTGSPSPDGRWLSFADPATGELAIRDLGSGAVRKLTAREPRRYAYFSVFSRDAKRIAYAWFNGSYYELRVAAVDGRGSHSLYSNEQAGFVQPCAWTPDGSAILTLLFRRDNISQIALVPRDGGAPRILRSLNWVYPKRMDLSPDGRFVVYDSFANGRDGDRTIYLLAVDGSKEARLVSGPGSHLFPVWTMDGRSVVYITERDGTARLMRLPVRDGRPEGEPELLLADAGRMLPMGITRSGELIAGVRLSQTDVFFTDFADPAGHARRVTVRFPGRNSAPAWSPDGSQLAYLSRRGTENFGEESRAIVIRTLDTDNERELTPKLADITHVRWHPDGRSLLVSGSDGKGRPGLFEVNASTGATRALVTEPGTSVRGLEGVWAPDGHRLYFIDGSKQVCRRTAETTSVVWSGTDVRALAIAPDGKTLAVAERDEVIIAPSSGMPRRIPLPGIRELEWGQDLVAGDGSDLWVIPRGGEAPVKKDAPGNRLPGFSLHPGGRNIAVTAGKAHSEIRAIRVSEQD